MGTLARLSPAVALAFVLACSTRSGGGDDDDGDDAPPDPKGWTISVDMSGLDRFVTPASTTSWQVGGIATATEGLARVDVAGSTVDVTTAGVFVTEAAVTPGLTVVPVVATDAAGNQRKAHRTLLAARFLPDGAPNPDGAQLVLTDEILASMGEGFAGEAADVDIAAEIMARDVLSQDAQCVTWPVYAEQGTVAVTLVKDDADLWLRIRIPNLYVYFQGRCQGLISTIPIAGEMSGTVDVWTLLTPRPPDEGGCLTAFAHSAPQTFVNAWSFDVWGTSGPLQSWIIALFSGGKSEEARAQIRTEVTTRADALLTERLAAVSVFDRTSALELLGRPLAMHLCVATLTPVGDQLIAGIAASATGAGTRVAPGAPQLDGASPTPASGELLLDSNLVAQLLFAAWRDGGLAQANVQEVDLGLIGLLMPALVERFPDARTVAVSIDGELPPLVRATPDAASDLRVEIGDLMLDLTVDGERIFRFGVRLTLELDLVPVDGALVPTLLASDAEVILLDELLDGPDDALEDAVALKLGDAAASLLAGAALTLPELPGLGAPVDVTADAAGRFLHVTLR